MKNLFLNKKPSKFFLLTILISVFSSIFIHAQQPIPAFNKSFDSDVIGPGSVSTLTFTIDNIESVNGATELAFTDVLPVGVTIATPANATMSNGSGTLSAPDGGTTISYSGGICGAGEICTITVDVTSSSPGVHTNTTGILATSSLGTHGTATDDLTVSTNLPGFSKSFSPSTINLGERSTLTFIIDNTENSNGYLNIDFTDNLPPGMVIANPSNTSISLVGGTLTALPGSGVITYLGSSLAGPALAAEAIITISVDVFGNSAGTLNNVTGNLTVINSLNQTFTSGKASATLEVLTPPEIFIQKSFSPNPVQPGGTTNLEFTLFNKSRSYDAANIEFTDDLTAVLTGLTATGTPLADICGIGSQFSGTTELTLTGGHVPAGGSVTFSVPLSVPSSAAFGEYNNTTAAITAIINGSTITGNTATEKLFVAAVPTFSKTFTNNPVAPGGTAKLEFTITNTDPSNALTDISFTDNITDLLGFFPPTISNMPTNGSCGGLSTFSTVNLGFDELGFEMEGGELAPGASYSFTIDIGIPIGFSGGTYTNTTSVISGEVSGMTVLGQPASDDLEVLATPQLSKSFTDDPVLPGGTATLEFTVSYSENATVDATNISFTDDLDAVISGLVATGLPKSDVCGTGSQLSGTSALSLTGGNMSPGESFTFSVPVAVPASATFGSYTNTTSVLSATVSDQGVTSPAASDDLDIAGLIFTKEFIDDPIWPGDLVTLRYTFDNQTNDDATLVRFTDELFTVLSGFAAETLPTVLCGSGAIISGTTTLNYLNGEVAAGTSCSFDVLCRVPASASSGTYASSTSNLTTLMGGNYIIIERAADNLEVLDDNVIELTKSFTNDPVFPGNNVTLEYTLKNLNADNDISNIAFTDNLEAAVSGLSATGLPITPCGATVSGTSTINFSGGNLAAGASCTFSVTLQTPGNAPLGVPVVSTTSDITGEMNSHAVVGDAATDNLEFAALIATKAFTSPVAAGTSSTLTFTLTNPDPVNSVSNIRFTDDLDAFISGATASDLPLNDVCGAGSTVTGASFIVFDNGSLAADETKTFDVMVQIPCGTVVGDYLNTTSSITAAGSSGTFSIDPATANLTIVDDFTPGAILATGETICYGGDPSEIGNSTAASGGDQSITYKWESSTDGFATAGSVIIGATASTYNPPTGLITTTSYRRYAHDGTCNTTFEVSTGTWMVTVYDDFTPGAILSTGDTICYEGDPSEIGNSTAASGGDESITYKWESSTDGFATAGTVISGAIAPSYNPPAGLTATTSYRRYTHDGTCNTTFEVSTGTWMVTVYDDFTPGEILATGETICYGGDPAEIGNSTAASGGDGIITYKWESSTDGFVTAGSVISGASASSYNPPTGLTSTTSYRRYAHDGTCNTTFEVSTGTWMVTVNDDFTPGEILTTGETICYGDDPAEIGNSTAASGGDGIITYKWESSTDGFVTAGTVISGATASSYNPPAGLSETTSYRRYAYDGTCNTTFEVSTGTWMVTVNDLPVANCKNITVYLDAFGTVSIDSSEINDGSTYDCGLATMTLNKSDFDCTNIGENMVTLTVTDLRKNTDFCTSTVTVFDTISPEALCQDVTVQLDANGNGTTAAILVDNGSNDACDIASLKLDITDFTCENLGENQVVLTVTDINGNISTCGAKVTVEDNVPPVMVCNPIEVVLYEHGEYVLNSRDLEQMTIGSSDNCSSMEDLTITVFPRSFECIHIGTPVSVQVTIADLYGNESVCQTTVNVYDETPPKALCKNVDVYLDEKGEALVFPGDINGGAARESMPAWARTYNDLEGGSWDACGIKSISVDTAEFSCSDIGENLVRLFAIDPSGNVGYCDAVVMVHDTLSPVVEAIEDLVITLDSGICETKIDYPDIIVNDNCIVELEQTTGLGADGIFSPGITSETWIAKDKSGFTTVITFNVTVLASSSSPTIDSIADIMVDEDTPSVNVPITGITAGLDCDSQDVTVTAMQTKSGIVTSLTLNYIPGETEGSIDLEISPETSGEAEITVTVEENDGATISEAFMLTVKPINDPPFLVTPISNQVVNSSYVLKVPISSALGEMFDDIDDTSLAITTTLEDGSALPAWAILMSDTLVFTPMIADTGCVNILITATDAAGASTADTIEICVDGYPVRINEIGVGVFEVIMYPNPTFGQVNMDITSPKAGDVEVSVMNVVGQEVFRKEYKSTDQISFNLRENVSGMYLVIMEIEGKRFTRKLILDKK